MKKFRSRNFAILLYPENENHLEVLEKIKKSYDYIYINHNKDKDENNKLKKEHYHVIIRVGNNARWNTALSEELKLELNLIQDVKNMDRMLQYLIHYNEEDKYQYDINECKGPLKKRLELSINKNDKTEVEKILEIMDIIETADRKLTMTELARYCAENGNWSEFRRSSYIFKEILYEHNLSFNDFNNDEERQRTHS